MGGGNIKYQDVWKILRLTSIEFYDDSEVAKIEQAQAGLDELILVAKTFPYFWDVEKTETLRSERRAWISRRLDALPIGHSILVPLMTRKHVAIILLGGVNMLCLQLKLYLLSPGYGLESFIGFFTILGPLRFNFSPSCPKDLLRHPISALAG